MSDIDKQVREIITRLFAYGVDWTEYRDTSLQDHDVSTYAAKIKSEFANEVANEITTLISTAVREAEEMARLDGQLMALNSFYNSGEIGSDSYKISVKQIADRFAQLKEEE
jgi:hypothetical protein